jgi:putative ABC transport system ATP-binding protein
MTQVLVGDRLTCIVADRAVLTNASLRLHAGESVALLGPSGSGKTMLLTTLAGFLPPQSGTVLFRGEQLQLKSSGRRRIASVFQTYGLFPLLTAAENVEIALRIVGHNPAEARSSALAALESLALGRFAQHLTQELSGGQEQRVAIARALATNPEVVLADEPTTEQDQIHRDLVLDQLLEVTGDGAAVLIATHDDEVAGRCDRVVQIRDGGIVAHAAGGSG